ncbi:hypothetical protein EPI10_006091 [Gossypium australe]|uniref:Uncharacterized protein n=1 Tax=Gossypium australe TaxID=47621 RepID=A0A5B6WRA7_9ROSI|nr:hypothetical protein EPI10_006091 [Gossypium australe]
MGLNEDIFFSTITLNLQDFQCWWREHRELKKKSFGKRVATSSESPPSSKRVRDSRDSRYNSPTVGQRSRSQTDKFSRRTLRLVLVVLKENQHRHHVIIVEDFIGKNFD